MCKFMVLIVLVLQCLEIVINLTMDLKGTPLPLAGFFHEHYTYKLKFDFISKTNLRSPCDKQSQLQLRCSQSSKQHWMDNPNSKYLLKIHTATVLK